MKTLLSALAWLLTPLCLLAQPLEPYRHNFFTTNPAPVVDVLPGTNVSVQFTTTGTSQRHYTVNSDTNVTVKVATSAVNSTNFWGTLSPTNLPIGLSTSNYVGVFSGDGTGLTNLYVGLTAGRIPVTDTGGILVTVPTLLYDDVLNQMIINENAVAGASSLVGTALSVRGADNAQIRIGVSSFGIAGAGAFAIRHARGTAALPTAASTGDQIMSLEGWGYGTTGYGVAPSVTVRGNAADLWTDTSMPSYITFRTTPTNSLLPVEAMRIDPNGWVGIGTNKPASGLDVGTNKITGGTYSGTQRNYLDLSVNQGTGGSIDFNLASGAIFRVVQFNTAGVGDVVFQAFPSLGTGFCGFENGVGAGTYISTFGAKPILFRPNRTTQMVLDAVGNLGIGTNAPQAKLHVELDNLGTTIVPALLLSNATAAALGAQQNSPALMLGGQGWRSGNSTTKPVQMGLYTVPVQGSSAEPLGRLTVMQSINNVAPASIGSYFQSDGVFVSGGNLFAPVAFANVQGSYIMDPNFNYAKIGLDATTGIIFSAGTGSQVRRMTLKPDIGSLVFGLDITSDWPSLKVETTNSPTLSIRTGNDGNYASLMASNITAKGSVTATNNYIHQLYPTNGFTYCNSTNEVYMVNAATNPIFVLPDASTVKGKSFLFTTTNNGTFFTVTNWTGTQTIADGTSLSYTNQDNGKKVVSFISDGAHWWLASKGRVTLPSASWSCNTNITFPNVTNMVTLDTQEANNGVGITLDNSAWTTVGVGSRIWVTNAGMYLLTFSAMWAKTGGGAANGDVWIRQDGTMIPRTMTLQTIQNATSTNVMTVNFILPVTKTTYFDLVGASPDGTAHMQAMPAITSPFARPAAPSIIVTLQKTSD